MALLPTRLDTSCTPPGQLVMFRVPADRGPAAFTIVDTAGFERLTTCALPTAMLFARMLLLAEGEVWVRSTDAITAHVAPTGVGSDDPARGWVRSLAAGIGAPA